MKMRQPIPFAKKPTWHLFKGHVTRPAADACRGPSFAVHLRCKSSDLLRSGGRGPSFVVHLHGESSDLMHLDIEFASRRKRKRSELCISLTGLKLGLLALCLVTCSFALEARALQFTYKHAQSSDLVH